MFAEAVRLILELEGGYASDPADPGGETKFGISKRSYPTLDIKGLTRSEAEDLYWRDYWLAAGCPSLAWPLALVHFDAAVNHGVGRARRFLWATQDWSDYLDRRDAFYVALTERRPPTRKFLRGWRRRLRRVRRVCERASLVTLPP